MDKWLAPAYRNLMVNKNFADCRIIVKDKPFECHKVILASASEYFERMFLSDFKEADSKDIPLEDVKLEIFEKFLEYIYTYDADKLSTYSLVILTELFEYGNRFLVPSIIENCLSIVEKRAPTMVIKDLVTLIQLGHNLSQTPLIDIVTQVIRNGNNYGNKANCYEALELTASAFEEYNEIVRGVLPEPERFKMIENYLSFHGLVEEELNDEDTYAKGKREKENNDVKCETKDLQIFQNLDINDRSNETEPDCTLAEMDKRNIRQLIKRLLDTIDYTIMDKDEFYNIVGKSRLLSYQQKFEYLYLTKGNQNKRFWP